MDGGFYFAAQKNPSCKYFCELNIELDEMFAEQRRMIEMREVDFVVTRDGMPWFLVEVKKSDKALSGSLGFFQRCLGAKHAFQVVLDAEYADVDCFAYDNPVVVPAVTFLSQLV